MEKLKSIGGTVLGLMVMLGIFVLGVICFFGVSFVAVRINPWLISATNILTLVSIFIFLPLAIFRKTRSVASIGLYVSSYVFGLSGWIFGLLATFSTLGIFWIIVGLLFMGIGVAPLGLVGSAIHGEWEIFFNLIYIIILTYGTRMFGLYLAGKTEPKRETEPDDSQLPLFQIEEANEKPEFDKDFEGIVLGTIRNEEIVESLREKYGSSDNMPESMRNEVGQFHVSHTVFSGDMIDLYATPEEAQKADKRKILTAKLNEKYLENQKK